MLKKNAQVIWCYWGGGGGGGELEMKTWIALASDLQFFLWFSWQKADFVMAAEAPYLM